MEMDHIEIEPSIEELEDIVALTPSIPIPPPYQLITPLKPPRSAIIDCTCAAAEVLQRT